jgi:hypothetical protein
VHSVPAVLLDHGDNVLRALAGHSAHAQHDAGDHGAGAASAEYVAEPAQFQHALQLSARCSLAEGAPKGSSGARQRGPGLYIDEVDGCGGLRRDAQPAGDNHRGLCILAARLLGHALRRLVRHEDLLDDVAHRVVELPYSVSISATATIEANLQ